MKYSAALDARMLTVIKEARLRTFHLKRTSLMLLFLLILF